VRSFLVESRDFILSGEANPTWMSSQGRDAGDVAKCKPAVLFPSENLLFQRPEVETDNVNLDSGIPFNGRAHLMGFPVDSVDMEGAISRIARFLEEDAVHHVVAINANKIWLAERTVGLREILQQAELIIPEYAAVWACRFLGKPVKGHVGGVMLLKALLPWLEKQHVPVYFLGAKTPVLELMQARLRASHPQLEISGMHSGYFQLSEEKEIVEGINRSGARLLFVAMGTPRQELWIERHRQDLEVRVAMGVGGSFDVVAGIKKDAPDWVRHGGEWIFRLAQDPRNLWKRYLTTNPWFVYRVLRERILPSKGQKRSYHGYRSAR
jgi:N-acetylglucosaminyldiphosphoundecaprenol N-acetyl-beta-D-mannosaminyltransferase